MTEYCKSYNIIYIYTCIYCNTYIILCSIIYIVPNSNLICIYRIPLQRHEIKRSWEEVRFNLEAKYGGNIYHGYGEVPEPLTNYLDVSRETFCNTLQLIVVHFIMYYSSTNNVSYDEVKFFQFF